MKNRVQRQLIYRVMWNDEVLSANIVPLSVTRHLSIWQFSHDSWRGASLQGRSKSVNDTMLTLGSLIGRNTDAIRGLVHRNMGRGFIGWFIKASRAILFHCKPSTIRQIGHFCSRLRYLMRTQGEKGTTLYLKSCQVLLQQSIAGYKVSDITELKSRVKRTKSGIPRIIPAGVRKRIREGDPSSIRLWMTLLGWYRITKFRGMLNLSTITDPGVEISPEYQSRWVTFLGSIFFPTLRLAFSPKEKVELPQPSPFPILKSGPQTVDDQIMKRTTVSSSFYSLVRSAKIWSTSDLKPALLELLKLWSDYNLGGRFPPIMERIGWAAMNNWHYQDVPEKERPVISLPSSSGIEGLAKLGFKEEAAGKVRVFAMVDPWTQWVMRPIHLAIFTILRGIPMDGTFNQTRPVEALRHLNPKGRWFYSIDLSAATDRLPISLQIPVMEQVFKWVEFPNSERAAQLWAELLVKRAYKVSLPPVKERGFDIPNDLPKSVTYSVGQPMGALSSWAMLALTHHAIVHWAAHRAKNKGLNVPIAFRDYAVLGDDIVILNKHVAREYLTILREIGVKAGLAKSIVAKDEFYLEFAKKFFTPWGRGDMLPLKEVIALYSSTLLTCEFVRSHSLTLNQILSVLGFGYKAKCRATQALYLDLSRRLRVLLVWFRSPLGCFPQPVGDWIKSSSWTGQWEVSQDSVVWDYIWEFLMVEVQRLMNLYYDASEKFQKSAKEAGALRDTASMAKKPISYHPSHLKEVLVRDDTVNQFVTERMPFSALVAPIEFDLHKSEEGRGDSFLSLLGFSSDASEFNAKYGVSDGIDVPPVTLPKSLVEATLFEQVFAINSDEGRSVASKCEGLVSWIFDFDKLASEIPPNYWPQVRAGEKLMREFVKVADLHEKISRIFQAFKLNPRSNLESTKSLYGNTPESYQDIVNPDRMALIISDKNEDFLRSLHGGSDALRILKLNKAVKRLPFTFITGLPYEKSYKRLIMFNRYLRDFIILASLVWFCPIYQPSELLPEVMVGDNSSLLPYFLVGSVLLVTSIGLGLVSCWLWLTMNDFELSAIDLLSRQAQQISEHEVRLIRMIAEREDLLEIIDGLEMAMTVSSQIT